LPTDKAEKTMSAVKKPFNRGSAEEKVNFLIKNNLVSRDTVLTKLWGKEYIDKFVLNRSLKFNKMNKLSKNDMQFFDDPDFLYAFDKEKDCIDYRKIKKEFRKEVNDLYTEIIIDAKGKPYKSMLNPFSYNSITGATIGLLLGYNYFINDGMYYAGKMLFGGEIEDGMDLFGSFTPLGACGGIYAITKIASMIGLGEGVLDHFEASAAFSSKDVISFSSSILESAAFAKEINNEDIPKLYISKIQTIKSLAGAAKKKFTNESITYGQYSMSYDEIDRIFEKNSALHHKKRMFSTKTKEGEESLSGVSGYIKSFFKDKKAGRKKTRDKIENAFKKKINNFMLKKFDIKVSDIKLTQEDKQKNIEKATLEAVDREIKRRARKSFNNIPYNNKPDGNNTGVSFVSYFEKISKASKDKNIKDTFKEFAQISFDLNGNTYSNNLKKELSEILFDKQKTNIDKIIAINIIILSSGENKIINNVDGKIDKQSNEFTETFDIVSTYDSKEVWIRKEVIEKIINETAEILSVINLQDYEDFKFKTPVKQTSDEYDLNRKIYTSLNVRNYECLASALYLIANNAKTLKFSNNQSIDLGKKVSDLDSDKKLVEVLEELLKYFEQGLAYNEYLQEKAKQEKAKQDKAKQDKEQKEVDDESTSLAPDLADALRAAEAYADQKSKGKDSAKKSKSKDADEEVEDLQLPEFIPVKPEISEEYKSLIFDNNLHKKYSFIDWVREVKMYRGLSSLKRDIEELKEEISSKSQDDSYKINLDLKFGGSLPDNVNGVKLVEDYTFFGESGKDENVVLLKEDKNQLTYINNTFELFFNENKSKIDSFVNSYIVNADKYKKSRRQAEEEEINFNEELMRERLKFDIRILILCIISSRISGRFRRKASNIDAFFRNDATENSKVKAISIASGKLSITSKKSPSFKRVSDGYIYNHKLKFLIE